MSKRVAGYQLTAENFDQEDDSDGNAEVAGKFAKAPEEVISKRIIKKAKRRGDDPEVTSSPFKGFTGFGSTPSLFGKSTASSSVQQPKLEKPVAALAPSFGNPSFNSAKSSIAPSSFLTNSKPSSKLSDVKIEPETSSKTNGFSIGKGSNPPHVQKSVDLMKSSPIKQPNSQEDKDHLYVEQITELNISVLSWIKQHIDDNPLIDLTPVFKDYGKYMTEIERKYGKPNNFSAEDHASEDSSKEKPKQVPDMLAVKEKEIEIKSTVLSSTPLFGSKFESKTTGLSSKTPVAGFFSAVQTSTPAASSSEGFKIEDKKSENEDCDEEVPKVERKTVVEADAFYTTRCKLFFKKGQEWKELGVGMLYLKPLNNKTQLLVRMETSGGNVILNICLHSSLPCSRVGKNNISLASVPNPPVFLKPADGDNSKPVTYLIRVKGAPEADELLKIIDDKKCSE